ELWIAPSDAAATWQALVAAGAEPAGVEALELDRIARGEPRYGQDIRERELPQETGQQRALHFQKGCYIGQEIVERIRSRGAVHRQFSGFVFRDSLPAPGAKIEAAGKEVGEITSTAALPGNNGGRRVGLGYMQPEARRPSAGKDRTARRRGGDDFRTAGGFALHDCHDAIRHDGPRRRGAANRYSGRAADDRHFGNPQREDQRQSHPRRANPFTA